MSRTRYILSALTTYTDGQALPSTPERLTELAQFIDDHLERENAKPRHMLVELTFRVPFTRRRWTLFKVETTVSPS